MSKLRIAKEAAEYLRVSEGTIRQYVYCGNLQRVKIGKRVFITKIDLDLFISRNYAPARQLLRTMRGEHGGAC